MPTTVDEIRAHVRQNDVQFLFAQFVDMHGKPSAKLVPASHLDDLLADGAGFAGYAAGPVGPEAQRSRPHRDARPGELHGAAVEAGGRAPGL